MQSPSVNILSIAPYTFLPAHTGGHKNIDLFYRYVGILEKVTVVSTKDNDAATAKNYKLIQLFSSSQLRYINLLYFFSIKKLVAKENITHIILEHPYMGWLGILLKLFTKAKLVIHSHNIEGLRFRSAGKWWWRLLLGYEKMVHRQADLNFFITEADKQYAAIHFKLQPTKCFIATYGIEIAGAPAQSEKLAARQTINTLHTVSGSEKLLLFNGAMNYAPNINAVNAILNNINPLLQQATDCAYKIIICGKDLPAHYHNLTAWKNKNIIFAGFVQDIRMYFLAADIFINPVIEGGGIKTKLVEALAYGNSVVSTKSGAVGIPDDCAGHKMKVVADGDWQAFAQAIVAIDPMEPTSAQFYQHFYWGNIANLAVSAINSLV